MYYDGNAAPDIPAQAPSFTPARPRLALGLLALGLFGVLAFCGILYLQYSLPAPFDAEGYSTGVPEEVVWQVSPTLENGTLYVEGWALELHRYVEKVEIRVLLYSAASGEYLRLPTAMAQNDGLGALFEDGPKNYPYGGFTARVKGRRLPGPPEEYEICLAFSHNQMDVLVHTGEGLV